MPEFYDKYIITDVKIDFKNCRHFSRFFSALFISSSHKKAKMKEQIQGFGYNPEKLEALK